MADPHPVTVTPADLRPPVVDQTDTLPPVEWSCGPVEFERVVPPSGNLQVCGKQFWLGPARSGVTVTFWADADVIHLLIAGSRIKKVRSHLSVADPAVLARNSGRPARPSPLPHHSRVRRSR